MGRQLGQSVTLHNLDGTKLSQENQIRYSLSLSLCRSLEFSPFLPRRDDAVLLAHGDRAHGGGHVPRVLHPSHAPVEEVRQGRLQSVVVARKTVAAAWVKNLAGLVRVSSRRSIVGSLGRTLVPLWP